MELTPAVFAFAAIALVAVLGKLSLDHCLDCINTLIANGKAMERRLKSLERAATSELRAIGGDGYQVADFTLFPSVMDDATIYPPRSMTNLAAAQQIADSHANVWRDNTPAEQDAAPLQHSISI